MYQKALVFTNTRARADALGAFLIGEQVRAAVLHGELDQRERKRVIGLLERGQITVLVASDVAARGLDLTGVERVINADVPRSGKDYLHRTGRTGRAGQTGIAISLVSSQEWNKMESINRWLGIEVELRRLPGLEARFKGPNPQSKARAKASSKSSRSGPKSVSKSGIKGSEKAKGAKTPVATKPKQRLRDRKNIGKRRKPSASGSDATQQIDAGFAPPKRRQTHD